MVAGVIAQTTEQFFPRPNTFTIAQSIGVSTNVVWTLADVSQRLFENNTISMGLAIIGSRPDVAGVKTFVRMECCSVRDITKT